MKHFSQWKNSAKAAINKLKELQGNYYNKEFHMLWFNRIYVWMKGHMLRKFITLSHNYDFFLNYEFKTFEM